MAWLGTTLRLEARDRRLELRPTANGVVAAYLENGGEVRSEPLDLAGDAGEFWCAAGWTLRQREFRQPCPPSLLRLAPSGDPRACRAETRLRARPRPGLFAPTCRRRRG